MKKKLFQFAVIYHERIVNIESKKETFNSMIISGPENVLATDEKTALLMVAKRIPDEHLAHLEDIEILIKGF